MQQKVHLFLYILECFPCFAAISLSHWNFDPRRTMKTSRIGVSDLFLANVGQLEGKDWKWHEFWFASSVAQSGIFFFWMFKFPRTNLISPSRKVKCQKVDSFNRKVKMLTIKELVFMLMFKKLWLVGIYLQSVVFLPFVFGRWGEKDTWYI